MQYCITAFLFTVERSRIKNSFVHFLRACCMFNHCTFWSKIAFEDCNASVCTDCFIIWSDDVFLCEIDSVFLVRFFKPLLTSLVKTVRFEFFEIFSERLSCYSLHIKMKDSFNLFHDCRYTAGIIEEFSRPFTRRSQIKKVMRSSVQSVESIARNRQSVFVSYRRKMKKAVRAS